MDNFQLWWRYSKIYRNRETIYGGIVIISGLIAVIGSVSV